MANYKVTYVEVEGPADTGAVRDALTKATLAVTHIVAVAGGVLIVERAGPNVA